MVSHQRPHNRKPSADEIADVLAHLEYPLVMLAVATGAPPPPNVAIIETAAELERIAREDLGPTGTPAAFLAEIAAECDAFILADAKQAQRQIDQLGAPASPRDRITRQLLNTCLYALAQHAEDQARQN